MFRRMVHVSSVFLRLALGMSFLSAVADRFGYWGEFGQRNVAWGDFARFTAYTARLNWFMPSATIPVLAWASTCAEILLGLALILGAFTRIAALLSGLLLLLFAISMALSVGAPQARRESTLHRGSVQISIESLNQRSIHWDSAFAGRRTCKTVKCRKGLSRQQNRCLHPKPNEDSSDL